jgi:phage/plasmid-associated DNA primase
VPVKKIPNYADLLIKEEGSGILNWALEGISLLLKDIAENGDIRLTDKQTGIVDNLLAESDSLRHFLMDKVTQDDNLDLTTSEIVEAYAEYCPLKKWNPKPITVVHHELEGLMLELFRTSKSGSIQRGGKSQRGFRKVAFKKPEGDQ